MYILLRTALFIIICSPITLIAQQDREVEPNETFMTALPLAEGNRIGGSLHQNGSGVPGCPEGHDSSDFFLIPRTEPGDLRVDLDLTGGEGGLGIVVRVHHKMPGRLTVETSFEQIRDTVLTFRCLQSDTVYLELSTGTGQLDGCVDYRIGWEHIPPPGAYDPEPNDLLDPLPLEPGASVEGRLMYDYSTPDRIDGTDSWSITGFPSGSGTITVTVERESDALVGTFSLGPVGGGQLIDTVSTYVFPCVDFDQLDTLNPHLYAHTCFSYRLRVDVASQGILGYRPDPEPNDRIESAAEMLQEGGVEGRIGMRGVRGRDQADYWSLTLEQDDTLEVELEVHGDAEVTLRLYDPADGQIEIHRSEFPRTGDDTIRFRAWRFSDGVHTLAVTSSQGCAEYRGSVRITENVLSVPGGAERPEGLRAVWRNARLEIDRRQTDASVEGLQIHDMSGRMVFESEGVIQGDMLPLELSPGPYLYRIRSGERTFEGSFFVPAD